MDNNTLIDSVTAISTALIALTGAVALVFGWKTLKQSREAEQVKHLVEFTKEFDREPMMSCRRRVAQERCKGVPFPDDGYELLDFFETIGLLVRRGYLSFDDVWDTFSYWIFNIYSDFRTDIEEMQRDGGGYYSDFCVLVDGLREIEAKRGGKEDRPSREEIADFWQDEMRTTSGTSITKHKKTKAEPKAPNGDDADPNKVA